MDWQIFLKALDYLCIKPNGSFYTVNMFHATFVENYSQLVQIFDTHNLRNQLFIELIEHNGSSKCPENLKNPEKIPVIIDDFGYGFSNYEHIFSLLPHAIKLDRLFLKMPERFVMELVMCFQSYGIDVVFEKCETQEELRWAKQMGFNYWQGYYANIVSHRHNLNYAQKETFTNV
ncbi:MAG: EAL domain-containing protein [Bacteroidota bacterium]